LTLNYYKYERDLLREGTKYHKAITQIEAIGLTYCICNEFKLPLPIINIHKARCSRFKYYKNPCNDEQKKYFEIIYHTGYIISGDVSHETAHFFQVYKTGKTRHDKKMTKVVAKIQKYVDRFI
jgi:hypothetical protein